MQKKLRRLNNQIRWCVAIRIIVEISCAVMAIEAGFYHRFDIGCFALIASIFTTGQIAGFQNTITERYNRILDDEQGGTGHD